MRCSKWLHLGLNNYPGCGGAPASVLRGTRSLAGQPSTQPGIDELTERHGVVVVIRAVSLVRYGAGTRVARQHHGAVQH